MAQLKTLEDLLVHEIQAMYSAEKVLLAGLPRMIQNTTNDELKGAFALHLNETRQQIERLKQAAKIIGVSPKGDTSPAMKGLVAENEKAMHKKAAPEVLDATLIAGAQKVEHYEIAAYGTAVELARELGYDEVADLLELNLEEEKKTNDLLTQIATGNVNRWAAQA